MENVLEKTTTGPTTIEAKEINYLTRVQIQQAARRVIMRRNPQKELRRHQSSQKL
jgi:hypothetical protein